MKRKAMLAVLLVSACLMAGCSSSKKETEAPAKVETEAKTEAAQAAAEAATEAEAAMEEAVSEAGAAAVEAASEAEAVMEEAVSEAGAAVEEAASEAEAVVEEAASEAEAVAEEAASEAEAVAEETMTEAEAAMEEAASEAEAVAEETMTEAEAVAEEAASEAEAVVEEAVSEAEMIAEETELAAVPAAVVDLAEETEAVMVEETEAAEEAAMAEETETIEEFGEEETEEAEESALEEGTEEAVEEETEEAAVVVELGERPEYTAKDYVTVGTYKGLMAEVTKTEISDADAEGEMNIDLEMAVEEKELFEKVTEGTIADGDTVNIDYEGKIDGEAFDGGTGNYDLQIGSGSFIPGFEEQLVGMNVGDTNDITVTFPDDYYEELAGKEAVFTVTANYIKKTPETSDELVSKATDGEYETVEDYVAYEKQKLTDQAQETQKSEAYTELMTQLYNTFTINSLPEDLVDYSLSSARNQYIQMAEMYGMTYEDMVASYGVDRETFEGYLKEDIEASLKQEMILNAIAEEEGITISEEEYQEGAQKYADSYGYETVEAFEEAYSKNDIETSLLMNKVIEFVYDNAVITEVEPDTEDVELLAEDETEVVYDAAEVIEETELATE